MTNDQFTSLYRAVTALTGQVGGLTEAVEQLERRQASSERALHALRQAEARRAGAVAATRELATKAGGDAARRERRTERWAQRAGTLIAIAISGYAAVFK